MTKYLSYPLVTQSLDNSSSWSLGICAGKKCNVKGPKCDDGNNEPNLIPRSAALLTHFVEHNHIVSSSALSLLRSTDHSDFSAEHSGLSTQL